MKNNKPIEWLGGTFTFDFQTRESRLKPMEEHLLHLKGKRNLKFLEIGSCEGQSTLWFLTEILTDPTSKITCIDPHRDKGWYNNPDNKIRIKTENQKTIYEAFKSNILDKYSDKVEYHRDRSSSVLPYLKSKFDLIYIDGNHEFYHTYMDGKFSINLLKKGRYIIFDDYSNDVSKAIEFLKRDNIITTEKVLHDKDILILKNAS
jgi:predicted O-methyltransferase YrrM